MGDQGYFNLVHQFKILEDNFLSLILLFCRPNSYFRQFLPKRPKTLFYSRHALTQFQSASSLLHMMRAFNLIKLFFLLCSHTKTFMRKVNGRTWSIQFSFESKNQFSIIFHEFDAINHITH